MPRIIHKTAESDQLTRLRNFMKIQLELAGSGGLDSEDLVNKMVELGHKRQEVQEQLTQLLGSGEAKNK